MIKISNLSQCFLICAALLVSSKSFAESKFTGPYAGGNLGIGSTKYDISHDAGDTFASGGEYIKGWNSSKDLGLQLGYNFQLNKDFILGLEVGYSKYDQNKKTAHEERNPERDWIVANMDKSAAFKGKFGYIINENVLVYTSLGYERLAYDLSNYNDRHDPSDSGYSIKSKNLKANATSLGLGVSWFIPKIEKVAFFAEANISKIHSEYKFSQQEMSQDTDVGDYSKIDKSAKFKFGFNYMF
jgi:opacity protein-like surface antigen